tara:strand:+ start:155 stop:343 length:189 start_codon:yes stop_codon:yes gene_type:complete
MTDKEKIEKAVALITELIEVAQLKDDEHKKDAIRAGKSEGAVGQSYDVFYLSLVKDILEGKH